MFLELIERGGITAWPLLVLSIAALGIILERCFVRLRGTADYAAVLRALTDGGRSGETADPDEARKPLERLGRLYLRHKETEADLRNNILKREAEGMLCDWNRNVRFLGLTASLAPLIGLAGTVLGLVAAFQQIELNNGQVNPADLAGGIWEALISTVFGMAVAIPSAIAFHFLHSGTEKLARQMKALVSELDEWMQLGLRSGQHSDARRPTAQPAFGKEATSEL